VYLNVHPLTTAERQHMRTAYDDVKRHICDLLERRGVPPPGSTAITEILLEAEGRGYPAQGVSRVKEICRLLDSGILSPIPSWDTVETCPSARVFIAQGALGHPVALAAIDTATTLAKLHGIGCVGVRGTGHIGYLTYYAERAANAGMLCVVSTVSPPAVVLPGSNRVILGTNPVAFAFPTREGVFCADFSTAEVSRGVVISRAERSLPFDHDVGVDFRGKPTNDPADILSGGILPLGNGLKGVLINVLFGILAGPFIGGVPNHAVIDTRHTDAQPNKGDWFMCFDIERFCNRETFEQDTGNFLCEMRSMWPNFHVPGNFSRRRMADVLEHGFGATAALSAVMRMS